MKSAIKAVALDVDGVLTDGTFYWGPENNELKSFSYRDVMGISRATKQGLIFALISGEKSLLIDRYALKLGITSVYQNCKDKAAAITEFAKSNELQLSQVCFMGDDINDLEAMRLAGLSAAPANAHHSVLKFSTFVTKHYGGNGAVRELLDHLLE